MFLKYKNTINRTKGFLIIILSALIFCGCPLFTLPLESPKNIWISNITSESAIVSWSYVLDADSYEIWWTFKGNEYWNVEKTDYTSFILKDLVDGEIYSVRIRAIPAIYSDYIPSDSAIKNFNTPEKEVPAGELARPRHVTLTREADGTGIKINWDAVEGAAYYNIKCSYIMQLSDGDETVKEKTVTVSAEQTSYTDTEINGYNVIQYSVAARDADFSNIGDKLHWSKTVNLKK